VTKTLKALVRLRRKKKMTQVEVGRRMKKSRQQVSNLESGRQGNPSIKSLEEYARAVGANLKVVDLTPNQR
jgi:transcriptional regulator with XRE-family HTH domain